MNRNSLRAPHFHPLTTSSRKTLSLGRHQPGGPSRCAHSKRLRVPDMALRPLRIARLQALA